MTVARTEPNKSDRRNRVRRFAAGTLVFIFLIAMLAWYSDGVRSWATKLAPTAFSTNRPSTVMPQEKNVIPNSHAATITNSRTATNALPTIKSAEEESFLASIFKGKTPEICGLSAAEASAFIANNGIIDTSQGRPALAEVVSKFVQSDNLHEKSLGLYLLAHQAGADAMEAERVNYPGCKSSEACSSEPYAAMQRVRSANAEPLVKLALTSNDASVYATALYACGGTKTDACGTITYAHWAEMEPDNAAAWLTAANEAELRKDSVARAAALQHAIDAKGYDSRAPRLAEVLKSESVQAQLPLAQLSISSELAGLSAMSGIQSTSSLLSFCGRRVSMDETRRSTCDAIATKLVNQDESLWGLMMARSFANRLGWDAERMQALNDEYAVVTGQMYDLIGDENMFSCDALNKSNQVTQKTLSIGERAVSREFVKNSGKKLSELAEDYRKKFPGSVK